MGIGKCLGFGRLATLFRRQFDGVALVVHGVSLFINLAIFQLAGLRHKSNTAVGKWKASSCEPPRQTVRRPSRTAAAYRSKPYQALNPSQFDTIRHGNPELIFGWRAQRPKAISRVTFVLCAPLQSAYHRYMRHFNTKQVVGGGTRFNCVHCPYSVNTLDFAILNGNLRTQAAAAINQHSASEHVSNLFSSKPIVLVTPS
jgi:hypothetical protein